MHKKHSFQFPSISRRVFPEIRSSNNYISPTNLEYRYYSPTYIRKDNDSMTQNAINRRSSLHRDIKKLSNHLEKQRRNKELNFIKSLESLTNKIDSKPKLSHGQSPSKISLRSKQSLKSPPQQFDYVSQFLQTMQKQQELMLHMIKSNKETPKVKKPRSPIAKTNYTNNQAAAVLHEFGFKEDTDRDFLPNSQEIAKNFNLRTNKNRFHIRRRFQVTPKMKVKAVFQFILFLKIYLKDFQRRKLHEKNLRMEMFEDGLNLYIDYAKGWVQKAIRSPLYAAINDENNNLDLVHRNRGSNLKTRTLKVQVIVRGIIEGLFEQTTEANMTFGFRSFLYELSGENTFLSDRYIWEFERSRLKFRYNGALEQMNSKRKAMMLCIFIVSRIMADKIFLQGTSGIKSKTSETNLKILGSIMHFLVLSSFANSGRERETDKFYQDYSIMIQQQVRNIQENYEPLSEKLFSIQLFEGTITKEFLDNMRRLLMAWTNRMVKLIERSHVIKN